MQCIHKDKTTRMCVCVCGHNPKLCTDSGKKYLTNLCQPLSAPCQMHCYKNKSIASHLNMDVSFYINVFTPPPNAEE